MSPEGVSEVAATLILMTLFCFINSKFEEKNNVSRKSIGGAATFISVTLFCFINSKFEEKK
jgi:hypothetical protein